jgi:hypothetical protein
MKEARVGQLKVNQLGSAVEQKVMYVNAAESRSEDLHFACHDFFCDTNACCRIDSLPPIAPIITLEAQKGLVVTACNR